MREIKFRAWDKNNKKMLPNAAPSIEHGNHFHYRDEYGCFCIISKDNSELMQFTGLLDKNGKEVYEGDIIKNKRGQCVVCYDGIHQSLGYRNAKRTQKGTCSDMNATIEEFQKQFEIIGNIYENPELLKGAV